MKTIEKNIAYKVGVLAKRGNLDPKKPEYAGQPVILYGNELHEKGIKTTTDFFRKNPLNLPTNKVYHIHILEGGGEETYYDQGTATAPQLSGLGELPSPNQPKMKIAQDEQKRIEEQQRNTNNALSILERELDAKNNMIASLQEQLMRISERYENKISELQQDYSIAQAQLAQKSADYEKEKQLRAKEAQLEDKLQKEYEEDVKKQARQMQQSSGMGSLESLLPIAQMLLPMFMNNNQQPVAVPPPPMAAVPVPQPQPQPQQVNAQLQPAQWGNNGTQSAPQQRQA